MTFGENVSDNSKDILDDIDETLDLSDLDEVDSVIDDLDKSLSDIDIDVDLKSADSSVVPDNSEPSDAESAESLDEEATGEIQVPDLEIAAPPEDDLDSTTEVLLDDVNAAMEEIDNLQEIDDFDPLEAGIDDDGGETATLPDFKESEDITSIISILKLIRSKN